MKYGAGLTNTELEDLCQSYNIEINGIFSKDKLPKPLKNGWYIVNLQSANDGEGSHWLALKHRDNEDFYFDSMGFIAPEELEKIMNEYIYNSRELQDEKATSCGWWVLTCILETEKDEKDEFNFKKFLYGFGNNTLLNEDKLNKMFFLITGFR